MSLKIFNINMWLLPIRFSKHNGQRVKKLIHFVKKLNPDIITLQEIWQKKHIKTLKKHLKEYHLTLHKTRFWNKSGLVVLSKEKPVKQEYFAFKKIKERGIYNRIAPKGVLVVHFKKEIVIYNTHLHHRTDGEKIKVAYGEFNLVKKRIKKSKTSILCGDLNLTKTQFDKINKGFFLHAEDSQNTFSKKNPFFKKWWEKKMPQGNKKIDYIVIRTNKKFLYKSRTIKNPVMSDHYGIYSEIDFT